MALQVRHEEPAEEVYAVRTRQPREREQRQREATNSVMMQLLLGMGVYVLLLYVALNAATGGKVIPN